MNHRHPRQAGLTLVELMIVLAVAGIVLSAALPSLQSQMRQGRRADAMHALAHLQLAQERWRAEHASYADDLALLRHGARSPAGHYALRIERADAHGYTLLAEASSAAQRGDRRCAILRLQLGAARLQASSMDADGLVDLDNANRCWVL
jgi:type IV pilus assembly protein PilE